MHKELHWKNIITFMGAFIAFSIGSGFASGQEIMQNFTAYGYECVLAGFVFLSIIVYTNCSFLLNGHREKFEEGNQIFYYYCGPYLGKFFDCFAVIVCLMSFVMMVAGASAAMTQQFGWPTWIGACLLAGFACVAVVFGLNTMVDIIGKIGPVIIVFIMTITIITLVSTGENIPEGAAILARGEIKIIRGGSNWFTSAIAYAGFALLWYPGFCAKLSEKHSIRELLPGAILGLIITGLTGVALAFAFIANIRDVAETQVPSLVLAEKIFPGIAAVFSIVIFLAIFSCSSPLLWTTVVRFGEEKTKIYTFLTVVLSIVAVFVALLFPFNVIVNFIFTVNGYVGFIFVFCMIVKDVRYMISVRKNMNHVAE